MYPTHLAKKLFDLGIELQCIHVVGDNVRDISRSVKELSSNYDIVFTSGGIGKGNTPKLTWNLAKKKLFLLWLGPTHDDITYESIAAAYNLKMKVDQETYDYIKTQLRKRNRGSVMTKYHARMATFPSPALLLREIKHVKIPIVVVNDNIHILPGIPSLFERLLDSLEPKLSRSHSQFYRLELATGETEVAIADVLLKAQLEANQDQIKIGSYPVWNSSNDQAKVIVTVSGRDQAKVYNISESIRQKINGWPYTKSRL